MSGSSQNIQTNLSGNQAFWVEDPAALVEGSPQEQVQEQDTQSKPQGITQPNPVAPQADPAARLQKSLMLFKAADKKVQAEIQDMDSHTLEARRTQLRRALPEDSYDATLEHLEKARELMELGMDYSDPAQFIQDLNQFEKIIFNVDQELEPELELEHRLALFRTRFLLIKSLGSSEESLELLNSFHNSTYDLSLLMYKISGSPELEEYFQEFLEKITDERDYDLFQSLNPEELGAYFQSRAQADEAWSTALDTDDVKIKRQLLTQAMVLYSQLPFDGYVESILDDLEATFSEGEEIEHALGTKIYFQLVGDEEQLKGLNSDLRVYHEELSARIEVAIDPGERIRLLSLKTEISLNLLAEGPQQLTDIVNDWDLDSQALSDLADLRYEIESSQEITFTAEEKFPALMDLSVKTLQLEGMLVNKWHGEVWDTFQKEKSIIKDLGDQLSRELLAQPSAAPEEQKVLAEKIATDLSTRLAAAMDNGEVGLLAGFDESALVEFTNTSQVAHALILFTEEGEGKLSAHLQAAQVFAQLGLPARVTEVLAPIHAQASDLAPKQQANLEFTLAQVYQVAGLSEQADAAFDRVIALETAQTNPELQEFVTLARGMKALNAGELEKGARYLNSLPNNELAQDLVAKVGDLQVRQRAGRSLEVLQIALSSKIAALEESGNTDRAATLKRDFEKYLGETVRRLEKGQFDSLGEVVAGIEVGSELGAYLYETSAGGTTNNFLQNGTQKDLSDEEFSQKLLALTESYAEGSDFATAGAIASLLQEDPWVGSQAKIFLSDLPDMASMDALISEAKNFSIYFAESETAALKSAGITLVSFGTGKLLGVGAEALWVSRMAGRISSPALFRAGGWLVRSGSEAAGFTLGSFSMQSAYTGRVDHWTLKNFSLETGKMLVTFGLLHGAGAGMGRLGATAEGRANRAWSSLQTAEGSGQGIAQATRRYQAANLFDRVANSGITQWGGRVLAFTGSDYFNEAIGEYVYSDWHHAEGTSFGVRLAHSAFMDAQMMLAGKVIDGVSGGRIGNLEARNQRIYQIKANVKPFAEEVDAFLAESGLKEGKIFQSVRRNLIKDALKRGMTREQLATTLRDPSTWVAHDVRLLAAVNRAPVALRDGLLQAEAKKPGAIHEFFAAVEAKNYHEAGSVLRKHKIPYWITPKGKLRANTQPKEAPRLKATEAEVAQAHHELKLAAVKRFLNKAGLLPAEKGQEGVDPGVVWGFLKAHFNPATPFSLGTLASLLIYRGDNFANRYLAQTGMPNRVGPEGKFESSHRSPAKEPKPEVAQPALEMIEVVSQLRDLARDTVAAAEKAANSVQYVEEKTVVEKMLIEPKTVVEKMPIEEKTPVEGLDVAAKDRRAEEALEGRGIPDSLDLSSPYLRSGQLSEAEIRGQKKMAEAFATEIGHRVLDFYIGLGLLRPTRRHNPVRVDYTWTTRESGQKQVHCRIVVEGKERAAQLEKNILVEELGRKLKEIKHENGVTEYEIPSARGGALVKVTFETKEVSVDPVQVREVYEGFQKTYYPILEAWVREPGPRGNYSQKLLSLFEKHEILLQKRDRTPEEMEATATVLANLKDVPFMIRQLGTLHRSRIAENDPEQWGSMIIRYRLERQVEKLAGQVESRLSSEELFTGKIKPENQELWSEYHQVLQELENLVGATRLVEAIDLGEMAMQGGQFQVVLVPQGSVETLKPEGLPRFVIVADVKAPEVIGEFLLEDGKWTHSLYHSDHFSPLNSGLNFLAGDRPLKLVENRFEAEPGFPAKMFYQGAKVEASYEMPKTNHGAAEGGEVNLLKFSPDEIQTLYQLGIHPDSLAAIAYPGRSEGFKSAMVYALGYLLKRANSQTDGRTEWAIVRLTGALRQQLRRGNQSTATMEKLLAQVGRQANGLIHGSGLPASEIIFLSGTQQKYLETQFGGQVAPTMVTPHNVLGILVAIHQRSTKGSYMGDGHQKLKLKPTGWEILGKIISLYGDLVKETHPVLYQHYLEITQPEPRGWESTSHGRVGGFSSVVARNRGIQGSQPGQPEFDSKAVLSQDLSSFGYQRSSLVGQVEGLTRQSELNFDRGGVVQWLMEGWYETRPTNGAMTGDARPVSELEAIAYNAWQAANGFPKVRYSQAQKAWQELQQQADQFGIELTIPKGPEFINPREEDLQAFLTRRGGQVVYLNELLKTLPESFLSNPHLKGIRLDTQRQGTGRFSSFEDGHAYIYMGAFEGSRRNFAGLVLHELGHGTASSYTAMGGTSSIPLSVRQQMYQSYQEITRNGAHVGLDFLDGSSARQRYQAENYQEFLAEFTLNYVAAGAFLRQHIRSFPEGSPVRAAWEFIYKEMQTEVFGGAEYDAGRRVELSLGKNRDPIDFGAIAADRHEGIGYGSVNEDRLVVLPFSDGKVRYIAIDGMGGHEGGERAAAIAERVFKEHGSDLSKSLEDLIHLADQAIQEDPEIKKIYEGHGKMPGAVAIAVQVEPLKNGQHLATFARVGDAEAIVLRPTAVDVLGNPRNFVVHENVGSTPHTRGQTMEIMILPYANVVDQALGGHYKRDTNQLEINVSSMVLDKGAEIYVGSDGWSENFGRKNDMARVRNRSNLTTAAQSQREMMNEALIQMELMRIRKESRRPEMKITRQIYEQAYEVVWGHKPRTPAPWAFEGMVLKRNGKVWDPKDPYTTQPVGHFKKDNISLIVHQVGGEIN